MLGLVLAIQEARKESSGMRYILLLFFLASMVAPAASNQTKNHTKTYDVGDGASIVLSKDICLTLLASGPDIGYKASILGLQDHSQQAFRFRHWYNRERSRNGLKAFKGYIWLHTASAGFDWVASTDVVKTAAGGSEVVLRIYQIPRDGSIKTEGQQLFEEVTTEAFKDLDHMLNAGFYFPLITRHQELDDFLHQASFRMMTHSLDNGVLEHEIRFSPLLREQDPVNQSRPVADISGDFLFSWLDHLFDRTSLVVSEDMEKFLQGYKQDVDRDLEDLLEAVRDDEGDSLLNRDQAAILREEIQRRNQDSFPFIDEQEQDYEGLLRRMLQQSAPESE